MRALYVRFVCAPCMCVIVGVARALCMCALYVRVAGVVCVCSVCYMCALRAPCVVCVVCVCRLVLLQVRVGRCMCEVVWMFVLSVG